jgi:hypothetical protein
MPRLHVSILLAAVSAWAQAPAPGEAPKAANRIIGAVTAKDASGKQITVKADNGTVYTVDIADTTSFVRVPPGETSLAKATKITAADVDAGDRVMARGDVNETEKRVSATRQIIVMTKGDIAQKHERDRAEWQRRGMAGVVTSVDTAAKKIVVTSGSSQNKKTVTVLADDKTSFRRYAPGSIRWEEAKPSSLAELKVGDQLRALGDKSADGSELTAQEIVSGSFTVVAGTIASIDVAKNEIRLTDVNTKKPVTISINSEQTVLKRLPPMVATMLARQLNPSYKAAAAEAGMAAPGGGTTPGGAGQGGSQRPQGAVGQSADGAAANREGRAQWAGGQAGAGASGGPGGPAGQGGAGGFGRNGGAPDFSRMLERMPAFTLAELKPGDALIVNSAEGQDATKLVAITVLAGVEPILVAAPRTFGQGSGIASWNLDMQMPMGQ